MPKTKKEKILKLLREKIKESNTILFLDFTGLKADAFLDLRKKIKKAKKFLKVVKKTLAQIAFDKEKKKVRVRELKGQLALAFGQKEDLDLIKLIYNFSREHENLRILGGLIGDEILEKEKIEHLAILPTRSELLSQFLQTLNSPISNFVFVLNANLQKFLILLSKIKNIKNLKSKEQK